MPEQNYKPGDWVRSLTEEDGISYGSTYQVKEVEPVWVHVINDYGFRSPLSLDEVDPVASEPTDLTKIDTPICLLDEETQERLKAWPHGVELFTVYTGEWRTKSEEFNFAPGITYRAIPAPKLEPMQPPWGVLPKWVRYVAMDGNDEIWAYEKLPKLSLEKWITLAGRLSHITDFQFYKGNMPWDKSLVEKPMEES